MIAISDVLAFAIALGVAAAIPGPGITALVARTVSGGTASGYAVLGGLIMGDMVFLTFAVFGLGLLAQTFEFLFIVVRLLSVAYLIFLAWQFWVAEHRDLEQDDVSGKTLFVAAASGLAITLGNPKAIAFYLALLPLVLDLDAISVGVWATVLVPTTILVLLFVGSFYILGIVSVRQLLSSSVAQKRLHRTASLAMAGAACSILAREF